MGCKIVKKPKGFMPVWVGLSHTDFGTVVSLASTEEKLYDYLYGHVEDMWDTAVSGPIPNDKAEAVMHYHTKIAGEELEIWEDVLME